MGYSSTTRAPLNATSGNRTKYKYDAFGRRVAKTVDTNTDGTPDVTTVFVYAGQQVLAEYLGGAAPGSPERKFIYGNYIDEPLVLIDVTGSGEDTYYYHRNRQYSIIGLTDDTGTVIERYAYTAYGELTVLAPDGTTIRSVSVVGNPYGYTGRRIDTESGLWYFRARYYDAQLGRFLQRDPLGYPDGMNGYAGYYVLWSGLDPDGLQYLRGRACQRRIDRTKRIFDQRKLKPRAGIGDCDAPCEVVTWIIKLPHSCLENNPRSLKASGHTGIAVGNDYFDYGPSGGNGDPGTQWWDDPSRTPGPAGTPNRSHADIGLDDIEADISAGRKGTIRVGSNNYKVTIVKIEVCVGQADAARIRSYWQDLYTEIASSDPPTYGVPGLHCSSSAAQSFYGGVLTPYVEVSPSRLVLDVIERTEHTCGSNRGKLVDFELMQEEDLIP